MQTTLSIRLKSLAKVASAKGARKRKKKSLKTKAWPCVHRDWNKGGESSFGSLWGWWWHSDPGQDTGGEELKDDSWSLREEGGTSEGWNIEDARQKGDKDDSRSSAVVTVAANISGDVTFRQASL